MSGKLLDSNILIYLSKKKLEFEKVASPDDEMFISVITYMEVMGYQFSNNNEEKFIDKLCSNLPVIDLDANIVEKVIQIRRKNKIKLPDAIILATAIDNNLQLITANIDDFSNIEPDLVIVNPIADNQ